MLYKTEPYAHQREAYQKSIINLVDHNYCALLMEMGTGKTKVAIDLACNLYQDGKINAVLVICPSGVQEQWYTEQIDLHSPLSARKLLYSTKKTIKNLKLINDFLEGQKSILSWFCVNVERFSLDDMRVLKPFVDYLRDNNCLIIIDESTSIKTPEAKRTMVITKLARYAKYRMILTGTPVTNSPFDVYSMFDFMSPNFWGCKYFIFRHRYGIFTRDRNHATGRAFQRAIGPKEFNMIRNYISKGKDDTEIGVITGISESNIRYLRENPGATRPFKKLDELKKIIMPYSFIVKKADCLDLPEKMYEVKRLEMTKDQTRVYNDLVKYYMSEYMDREIEVQTKVVLGIRLQQVTGGFFPYKDEDDDPKIEPFEGKNPKIEYLIHDIEEAGELRCIIWARFVAEIELIIDTLREKFPFKRIEGYYGGVPADKCNDIKNDFQKNLIDILVINPQKGAMGLNLQNASLNYMYSNTYSLMHREQLEARTHRIGQKNSVQYKDIVMSGTVDEAVLTALKGHKEVLDYFRDTDLNKMLV